MGEAGAAEVGRLAYEINVQQYACAGLNFGTYYDRSPIIAYDGAEQPAYTMSSYHAIDRPGLPHATSVAAATAARSTTRWGRSSRCCGSMPR